MARFTALIAAAEIFTFFLYGIDKKRAQKGRWRIKERTLLMAGRCFGAAGALLGMKIFRHKTKKPVFYILNFMFFVLQTLVLLLVLKAEIL